MIEFLYLVGRAACVTVGALVMLLFLLMVGTWIGQAVLHVLDLLNPERAQRRRAHAEDVRRARDLADRLNDTEPIRLSDHPRRAPQ